MATQTKTKTKRARKTEPKPLTKKQKLDRAKRVIKQVDGEQLLCRTFMHAWRVPDEDDTLLGVAPYGHTIATVCSRCGAQRIDGVSRFTGDLLTRRYVMPSGYLVKGSGGVSRKIARVEFIRRGTG